MANNGVPNKYESLHFYPEKLSHFWKGYEAEIWQRCRGVTQTPKKIRNPDNFAARVPKFGMNYAKFNLSC
jgi:hypothetical protein